MAFVTFEGIDGAGKSGFITDAMALIEGVTGPAIRTREPGGTPLGERLREMLLRDSMSPMTETMLMVAARIEHARLLIEPALQAGMWVVCDRYGDSTMAYQCGGRGVPRDDVQQMHYAAKLPWPKYTLLFDVEAATAAQRVAAARGADRFEQESLDFFERVRAEYLEIARRDPGRVYRIDANKTPDEVRQAVEAAVRDMLSRG